MDDIFIKRFLLDVDDAESLAKPYIKDVLNIDELLVSDSFLSFGGLTTAPALSISKVDDMDLGSKKTWIACRLWAICKKIRTLDNPSPQSAFELKKYSDWLQHPGISQKRAGSIGGKTKRAYSNDLNLLIKAIINRHSDEKQLTNIVFNKLVGLNKGVIEQIEKKEKFSSNDVDELLVTWECDEKGGLEILKKSAIRKRILKINKP